MSDRRISRNRVALAVLVITAALLVIFWRMVPVSMARQPASARSEEALASIAETLSVPAGYKIEAYASGLGTARVMTLTPGGDIILSSPPDRILLIKADRNGDGKADGVVTLIGNLKNPSGVFLDGDKLYVAEEARILRYNFDAANGKVTGAPEIVLDGLPVGDMHSSRTIKKGADGFLYVTLGSNCNVCIEDNPYQAVMIRLKPGEKPETFATGLRNAVGFDWDPATGALYATENGRDWLGDDFPPDEVNRIEQGKFYGWPFFNGDNMPDPDFGKQAGDRTATAVPPAHALPGHVAPLSLLFLRHQPADAAAPLQGAVLVTEHGSWNRARKQGYQVVAIAPECLSRGLSCKTETPIVSGFLKDGNVSGRPVDVAEAEDGTIFISDDFNGAVWRLSRPR